MTPQIIPVTKNVQMGEGPHWDHKAKALYFVNMLHSEIHKYVPATKAHTFGVIVGLDGENPITFVIPVDGEPDTFVVGYGGKLATVEWDGISFFTKNFKLLETVEERYPQVRLNDAKASPSGVLFAGSMGVKQEDGSFPPHDGNLIAYSGSTIKPILEGIGIGNGLAWTADEKKFYYIDSLNSKVAAYDYNAKNISICNETFAYDFAENNVFRSPDVIPDGMTIDVNGNLWVAVIGSGKVFHINPKTKSVLSIIEFPCTRVTSVAFGGPNLEDLYVTSAYLELTKEQIEKQPNAGCLFKVTGLGTKGLAGVPAKL